MKNDHSTYAFDLGAVRVTVLDDGALSFPRPVMAANAHPDDLQAHLEGLGLPTDDPATLGVSAVLLDTGDSRVLIDAGTGGAVPGTGGLLDSLAAAGHAPADVDVVVLTHLHFDHAGGALDGAGGLRFPGARHVVGRAEWDFWAGGPQLPELLVDDQLRGQLAGFPGVAIAALRDTVELIEPGAEIGPGVTAVAATGHTPGELAVAVESGGERLLVLADALTHLVQLARPEWLGPVETWPAHSVATRRALLQRAVDERAIVHAAHLPFPAVGRLVAAGTAFGWEPI